MNNEFKKVKSAGETRFVLEFADGGATSSGSIASVEKPLGELQRRAEPQKPRNFVAKNAKMGGAGQHKDKKKAEKQGDVKHKKPFAEGEVVPLGKKHRGDLDSVDSCPKCDGDLQSGTYMGRRVKVCQPCKQVYLPPNSGIDQQGNKTNEQGVAEVTGDKPFDKMMTTIKQGTGKQKTADRKEQQKQTQQRARDAFGNMFGGGNPADKLKIREQGVAEGDKKPHPKTWNDVDPTLGKQVDRMSQAEKVRKGLAHPDTLNTEQVYKVVALDKGNALKKPTKMKVKASSLEDLFSRLSANDWYPLEINGVEVIAGKRLKQGVAEGDSGAKYKVKSIGHDTRGDYYISPSTGKKVYKSGVKVGDHENPKTGEHKGVAEDHEIQMASSELQSIAKNAVHLLDLVRKYSEQEGLDAWQQSKITKAADYLNAVLQSVSGEQTPLEGVGIPFRGVGGAFNRGDDERHDLDVPRPSTQVWALKVNGNVDSNNIFASKEEALYAKQSMQAKNPGLEIGLVTKGGMPEDAYMESLMNMLERSVSQAQHNLMVGVAHNPAFAQKVGVKQKVGQEFANADQGHDISKLPIRVPKKK